MQFSERTLNLPVAFRRQRLHNRFRHQDSLASCCPSGVFLAPADRRLCLETDCGCLNGLHQSQGNDDRDCRNAFVQYWYSIVTKSTVLNILAATTHLYIKQPSFLSLIVATTRSLPLFVFSFLPTVKAAVSCSIMTRLQKRALWCRKTVLPLHWTKIHKIFYQK